MIILVGLQLSYGTRHENSRDSFVCLVTPACSQVDGSGCLHRVFRDQPEPNSGRTPAKDRLPRDNVLVYRGPDEGQRAQLLPVQSIDDWQFRRQEIMRVRAIMGICRVRKTL